MTAILEAAGLKWLTLVPGFIGALISLKFIEGLSRWGRVTTVFAGTMVAAYCTPLTVEYFSLSTKLEGAVAFLGGLIGMSVAGALISAVPEWLAAARKKWLE